MVRSIWYLIGDIVPTFTAIKFGYCEDHTLLQKNCCHTEVNQNDILLVSHNVIIIAQYKIHLEIEHRQYLTQKEKQL